MTIILTISRYFLPVLAIVIFILCLRALLFGRQKSETIAHLTDKTDGTTYALNMWESSIGRSKACDVFLDYSTVSRFHAVIARRLESWYIYDLNSKDGIKVNGKRVYKKAELSHDDAITFGSVVTFHFLIDDDPVVGLTAKKKRKLKKEEKQRKKLNKKYQKMTTEEYEEPYDDYTSEEEYIPEPPVVKTSYPTPKYTDYSSSSPKSTCAIIGSRGDVYKLNGVRLTFGSTVRSNVLLNNANATLVASIDLYEDGSWVISRHSLHDIIYLNDTPVNSPLVLFDGDKIRINNDNFKFIEFNK